MLPLLLVPPCAAQAPGGQTFEVGMVASLNIVSFEHLDDALAITAPGYAPGIRVTYWPTNMFLLDVAGSVVHVRQDNSEVTAYMLEGGLGVDFGRKEAKVRPYAGMLLGYANLSIPDINGGFSTARDFEPSSTYFGAQLGVRQFIRDYAATRAFVAYRKLGSDFDNASMIELGVGLSVFL